jgi:hypothetical protein
MFLLLVNTVLAADSTNAVDNPYTKPEDESAMSPAAECLIKSEIELCSLATKLVGLGSATTYALASFYATGALHHQLHPSKTVSCANSFLLLADFPIFFSDLDMFLLLKGR